MSEFYGINGKCVTFCSTIKGALSLDIASILGKISEALKYIHDKGFVHGDIKTDNIVIRKKIGLYTPVIIDFGKMRKINETKINWPTGT